MLTTSSKNNRFSIHSLSDLQLIQLSRFIEPNGELIVAEVQKHLPVPINRVFAVRADSNAIRGKHAHRQCTQVLICLYGAVRVSCDDGIAKREVELDRPDCGLLIPPSIWVEQLYLKSPTILLVLCDRLFEEEDYIRDREQFERYRGWTEKQRRMWEA